MRLRATPVKLQAQALGIPTIEPERLLPDALPEITTESFDLFVVASYGKIVPQWLLDVPACGALNVHPSLLPLYRGATPLQAQIRDGVTESGVTIILMDAGMDTGDIVVRERSEIGACELYGELHDRFADLGARALLRAIEGLEAGTLERMPQSSHPDADRAGATLTRPLVKADLLLEWERLTPEQVTNRVRAYAPEPLARGMFGNELVKIVDAYDPAREKGEGGVLVPCKDGALVAIGMVIPPNRKAMRAEEYLR
jgi:methionyl-tRNA formyltransferase